MKTLALTLSMLSAPVGAYDDIETQNLMRDEPAPYTYTTPRPLPPPEPIPMEPIGSTYDRINSQYGGPPVVVPIQPSPTGSTYIDSTSIRTPNMDCYRSVTGALVCQGH